MTGPGTIAERKAGSVMRAVLLALVAERFACRGRTYTAARIRAWCLARLGPPRR